MKTIESFNKIFSQPPSLLSIAPGRVNLLGEHVDYNDGYVLPAAIDRQVQVAAAPTQDGQVTLFAIDLNKQVNFHISELETKKDIQGQDLPRWAQYPAGVAWSLTEMGKTLPGIQAVFTSNIPIGAGLSSSAAVEVAFAAIWAHLVGLKISNMDLAKRCQHAENQYVGVNCGLMDQFASACGVKDHALFLDTRSLDWEPVPLPEDSTIIIADSGMRRSLAESAYNQRRNACEHAVQALRQFKPSIGSLRDVSTVEFMAYSSQLPDEIRMRAEHVVKEIHRVETAISSLQQGDARAFGALMYASHKSLRDLFDVSIPELNTLVELARRLPGIYGARLTGAGFGGCTVNLVQTSQAESFIAGLTAGYMEATGRQADVYQCQASEGVRVQVL